MNKKLKIGSVPYLVGRPLDHGLGEEPGIELQHWVPAKLVEKLRRGEIDVAMVSSIELFRQPGYRYIDQIAVAGRGLVSSVQVFLRAPLPEVQRIALDPDSRAAQALSRSLLEQRPGGAPEFLEVAPGQDPRTVDADGWLRIGDRALQEHHLEGLPYWNPSAAWVEATGLPFVFAPWIVRPGAELTLEHLEALSRAFQRGQSRTQQLAEEAAETRDLPGTVYRHYLEEECTYQLGTEEMQHSLLTFRDMAASVELCDPSQTPQPLALPDPAGTL